MYVCMYRVWGGQDLIYSEKRQIGEGTKTTGKPVPDCSPRLEVFTTNPFKNCSAIFGKKCGTQFHIREP